MVRVITSTQKTKQVSCMFSRKGCSISFELGILQANVTTESVTLKKHHNIFSMALLEYDVSHLGRHNLTKQSAAVSFEEWPWNWA